MNPILQSLHAVMGADFFWASMGMTVATSMFIGATIYNGFISHLQKGILTIVAYATFLLFTTMGRIIPRIISGEIDASHSTVYNGMITILLVTLFYILGLVLGVYVVRKNKNIKSIIKFKRKVLPILNKKVSVGDRLKIKIEYLFTNFVYPVKLIYIMVDRNDDLDVFKTFTIETISPQKNMSFVDEMFIIPKVKKGDYRLVIQAIYDIGYGENMVQKIKTEPFKVV